MAATFLKGGGGGGVARRRILKRSISDENSKPGGLASALSYFIALSTLTDNTVATFCTILMPNTKILAGIGLTIVVGLGDGDSAEASYWTIALSRIAGAASLIAISAKTSNVNSAGVTANAAATISNVAVAGANTAQQTFALQIKCARSGGASDNHVAHIDMQIYNILSGGAMVA